MQIKNIDKTNFQGLYGLPTETYTGSKYNTHMHVTEHYYPFINEDELDIKRVKRNGKNTYSYPPSQIGSGWFHYHENVKIEEVLPFTRKNWRDYTSGKIRSLKLFNLIEDALKKYNLHHLLRK